MSNIAWYPIEDEGVINRWLGVGSVTTPLADLEQTIDPKGDAFAEMGRWALNYWAMDLRVIRLKETVYAQKDLPNWEPGQDPHQQKVFVDGHRWEYMRTEADRMLDFSRFNFNPTLMEAWTFAYLRVPESVTFSGILLSIGPAHVWVNQELVYRFTDIFSYVKPLMLPFDLHLHAGINKVYLHGEMLGWREARLALGLQLQSLGNFPIEIGIPIGDVDPIAWQQAEKSIDAVQVQQFALPDNQLTLTLNPDHPTQETIETEIRLPTVGGPWAQFSALPDVSSHEIVTLQSDTAHTIQVDSTVVDAFTSLPGENHLTLVLRPTSSVPISREQSIWASNNDFRTVPYGTYAERRQEALQHLASMPYDVVANMALVAIGQSETISSDAITVALSFMQNRRDCADFYAVGLLAALYWYGDSQALQPEDKRRIEATFQGFKFWIDEPGLDAMCYFTENHQILFHVTAYLIGQYAPDWVFSNSGMTGAEQQERADHMIRDWILRRLRGNYSEWDSNAYLALDIFAMLALVEFAEDTTIQQMATTLVHKTLFMIAMQSYRGVHGSSHGRCYVEGLKSARVENTSGIQRIAWGMGILNGETRATGLLALARRYQVPTILQQIGADTDAEVITYARSYEQFQRYFDMRDDTWDIETITYRTPTGMLAAAIHHRSGEDGIQEHLWQATLSPEAVVFTTYPGNSQEHGQARPNYWSGSVILPQVQMFDRHLICLYPVKQEIGLGYTHAYFPVAYFDEVMIEGNWAFARYGKGYVGLWGDGELSLTPRGKHAGQELRSKGKGSMWVCVLGSESLDSSFSLFQEKYRQHSPIIAEDLQVMWETPNGDDLMAKWGSPFMVNDKVYLANSLPHYKNQYTDTNIGDDEMIISHDGKQLVLDLKNGRWRASH